MRVADRPFRTRLKGMRIGCGCYESKDIGTTIPAHTDVCIAMLSEIGQLLCNGTAATIHAANICFPKGPSDRHLLNW